jgi:hypothetical protein
MRRPERQSLNGHCGKPIDHGLELQRRAAFEAAYSVAENFSKWWNAASVRPRRKGLRADFDNLTSIARAADEDMTRERQAEETARQQQRDRERLDDPFGKCRPAAMAFKPGASTREPVAGAAA